LIDQNNTDPFLGQNSGNVYTRGERKMIVLKILTPSCLESTCSASAGEVCVVKFRMERISHKWTVKSLNNRTKKSVTLNSVKQTKRFRVEDQS